MQYEHQLAEVIASAIEAAQCDSSPSGSAEKLPQFPIPPIAIERPRDPSHGDYSSPTPLRLAKSARMAPFKIAQIIVEHLPPVEFISEVTVAKPGFINARLADFVVQQVVEDAIIDPNFGAIELGAGKRAQIEFVSANPTGPITIGRTRGGVIGDTLARLMEAAGYDVTREYYYNDAGRQIRLLGEAVKIRYQQQLGVNIGLGDEHYQGQYLVAIADQLKDEHGESLLDNPTEWFGDHAKAIISAQQKASLKRIGIVHDIYFNEANLYKDGRLNETIEQLNQNGYLYEKDGAWWLRTTAFGKDKDVVAVRSGDGLPTYRMPDIVYHKDKAERGFDIVVDIFGSDHHEVAQEVKIGVQMLGYDVSFVHTLIHQFVTLIRDGKEVRMSTRRGIYETLDDLVDEVGADPVRYFMISRSANAKITFDLDVAVEQSDKNPVYYIQNAHVRCAGIFRKWAEAGYDDNADADGDLSLLTHPLELTFLKKAMELSAVIDKCVTSFEPHHITFYAYDLAAAFHPAYDACRVLHDDVPHELAIARLRFYRAAQAIFARVLSLMGMSAPERM